MLDLSQKYNMYVTRICNNKGIPKKRLIFLKKCISIQLMRERTFSSSDFPEITPNNFRQYISRLKNFIEVDIKSSCYYYRVKNVPLSRHEEIVTDDPMGDRLLLMLQHIKEQPVAIHNIKIKFESNLYSVLSQNPNIKINSINKGIILNFELISNYRTKFVIYPNIIQIDIACTYTPVLYNIQGAFLLNSLLTLIRQRLTELGNDQVDISNFNDWILTHYHFGRDGKEEWNGKSFHITVKDALNQLVRYYSKEMKDKKRYGRMEIVKSPKIKISEELEKMSIPEVNNEFVN
ncbi:MAG: hypothetical protein HQ481_22195 [Alphaproteobacteria bacterium]|nr:hypothetical protein [Alphaproteobacteria bacterium]